jgi:TetR/AcrR family transcriptional regulator, cholesterol catabolism regulator
VVAERIPAPVGPTRPVGVPRGTLNVERWAEILEAAGEVFHEKGYQAARIEDIAARVGILKGSLYYYIQSKEDLLFALSDQAHSSGLESIREPRELLAADAPTRLGEFISRWCVVLDANPPYATVAEREVGRLRGDRYAAVMAKRNQLHGFVRSLLEQGIAEGSFDPALDPGVATNALFEMMNGTRHWFRPDGRKSTRDIGKWYREFVLRGLARPEAVEADAVEADAV